MAAVRDDEPNVEVEEKLCCIGVGVFDGEVLSNEVGEISFRLGARALGVEWFCGDVVDDDEGCGVGGRGGRE